MLDRLARLALGLGLCLLVGCTPGSSDRVIDRVCDRIPEEIGGCSADRPVFSGSTCRDLAVEWGAAVDAGLLKVMDEPKDVDGKAWSVRISDVLILASIAVGLRMHDLGIAQACDTPEFLPLARQQFSDGLEARVLGFVFDGEPATPDDWDVVLHRAIGVIDDDSPGVSPRPS